MHHVPPTECGVKSDPRHATPLLSSLLTISWSSCLALESVYVLDVTMFQTLRFKYYLSGFYVLAGQFLPSLTLLISGVRWWLGWKCKIQDGLTYLCQTGLDLFT